MTNSFFAELPFADLLDRAGQQLNLTEVLRSAEDAEEKPDLDRQFFEDLSEWFHGFRNVDWKQPADAAELTILLLNKLIFAKTLEDHGLVPYRFLQDEFEKQEDRWETKGPHRVVKAFLHEFEPFFDEYYDTELFERKIWDELDHDHENLQRFCGTLKRILGITTWDKVLSRRGVVNYNYRTINEDIFGKSYEMFLAANRKDEGIYYTPASITVPMTRSLVASVFGPLTDEICAACHPDVCDFAKARTAYAKLAELRITDTAAGSGGFLIKVLREIWAQYLRIEKALGWVDQIKLEGDLFDQPKNIRKAAEFREDSQLSDTRRLLLGCVVRHLNGRSSAPRWMQLVIKTNLMREVIRLAPQEFHFRRFPGSRRALSELSGWSIKRKIRLRAGRVVC